MKHPMDIWVYVLLNLWFLPYKIIGSMNNK
jgi:hypothetical protein